MAQKLDEWEQGEGGLLPTTRALESKLQMEGTRLGGPCCNLDGAGGLGLGTKWRMEALGGRGRKGYLGAGVGGEGWAWRGEEAGVEL